MSQSNSVDSSAKALNLNATGQDADQDQGGKGEGSCCSSGGIQTIGQGSQSDQQAGALSVAEQKGASNTDIPVRVLSPGDGGSVTQSNTVSSDATSANLNLTSQDAEQDQGGSGGTQAIGQKATSDQKAFAASAALQDGASNVNTPVRVEQATTARGRSRTGRVRDAKALNANLTKQDADQDQSGGRRCCPRWASRPIGQSAENDQTAAPLRSPPSRATAGTALSTAGRQRAGRASTAGATAAGCRSRTASSPRPRPRT